MIYKREEMKGLPVSTSIYAFRFKLDMSKEGALLNQTPVFGELRLNKTEKSDKEAAERGNTVPMYFVPYKKSGDLGWSRAVQVSSRSFADNVRDAIKGYNAEIDSAVSRLQACIDRCEELRLVEKV